MQAAAQQAPSVKDTVRDIIANTDFSAIMDQTRPKSSGALYPPNSRIIQVRLSQTFLLEDGEVNFGTALHSTSVHSRVFQKNL